MSLLKPLFFISLSTSIFLNVFLLNQSTDDTANIEVEQKNIVKQSKFDLSYEKEIAKITKEINNKQKEINHNNSIIRDKQIESIKIEKYINIATKNKQTNQEQLELSINEAKLKLYMSDIEQITRLNTQLQKEKIQKISFKITLIDFQQIKTYNEILEDNSFMKSLTSHLKKS
jgi:hypothetical protein